MNASVTNEGGGKTDVAAGSATPNDASRGETSLERQDLALPQSVAGSAAGELGDEGLDVTDSGTDGGDEGVTGTVVSDVGVEVLVDEVDELDEGGSLVLVVEVGTVEVDVDGSVVVGGDVVVVDGTVSLVVVV